MDEVKRLFGYLPIPRSPRRLQPEALSLELRVLERFLLPTAPDPEEVVGKQGVRLLDEVQIAEVSFHGRLDELPVIPVDDSHAVRLPFAEVMWQVIADAGPEKRRDAADGRYVVLVDVVKNLFVQGEKILELRFAESTLRGSDVSERVRD